MYFRRMETSITLPTRRPRYLIAEVAHASGVPIGILKSWLLKERRILALTREERPAACKGLAISFSWNRLCQVAAMEALQRAGCWLPSIAAKAALIFSDIGDDDIPGAFGPDIPTRRPAECFAEHRTILAVRFGSDDSAEPITEVHQVRDDEPFGDVWQRLTNGVDGITLLDCAAVVERVKSRLAIE